MSHHRKRVNAAATRKPSWRNILPIHPAAELFPLMPPDELRELGEDIKANGLQTPIRILVTKPGDELIYQLLDGRNRLDAIELAGFDPISPPRYKGKTQLRSECRDCGLKLSLGIPTASSAGIKFEDGLDEDEAYAYVVSANIRRRHLGAEQKRDLIAKLLKATPEKSDRQIAETVKASPTTVGAVRAEIASTVQSGQLIPKRIGKDGKARKQPTNKRKQHPASIRISGCAELARRRKLGSATVNKLRGTSLGSAAEMDELIELNRGAPDGEHTEIVKKLIADAMAGRQVSAVKYTPPPQPSIGRPEPPPRDDIGPDSATEAARLRVCVEDLQAQVRQRDIIIEGLRRDIAELQKTGGDPMSISEFQTAIKKWEDTVEVQRGVIARLENENARLRAGVAAPPPDDGLDIPECLRR
jgi:hypothetical protein